MSITNHQEAVMSNSTIPAQHPAVVLRSQYRQLRSLVAVLVVAVVGLSTTVVVLTVDDQTATTATTTHVPTAQLNDPFQDRTQPTRDTGKPDESAIAASISQAGSRSYPTLNDPFQSQVEQPRPLGGPNESAVAAAISPQTGVAAPDESKIAAAISEHGDTGPNARARAWQEKLDSMTPQQRSQAFGSGY
jgi:hypothetical protein